jgi:hypothetical protein
MSDSVRKLRVVIQYLPRGLDPRTRRWGEENGAEFVDTSADAEGTYRLLAKLWRDGEAFALFDQDVLPPTGALEQFESCAEDVCAFPFIAGSSAIEEIGCTRFSRALIRKHPNLIEDSVSAFWAVVDESERPYDESQHHWLWVPVMLRWRLKDLGYRYHGHAPAAQHFCDDARVVRYELARLAKLRLRRRPAQSEGSSGLDALLAALGR